VPEALSAATDLDLISFLRAIPDPRMQRGIRIPAWYLLLVAVLGILSHCQSLRDLERFAERHHSMLTEALGPAQLPQQLQSFLDGVHWLSLEELSQQAEHKPILTLLTLPVLPKPDIPGATKQILEPRPDLLDTVLSIQGQRFPHLTREEIMALINLPTDHLRDTRFGQELLAEGRLEGRLEGEARGRAAEAAAMAIRQLSRRCGPLSEATSARIQALPLQQLEALADALLDFSGPGDLADWLVDHTG